MGTVVFGFLTVSCGIWDKIVGNPAVFLFSAENIYITFQLVEERIALTR